MSIKSSQNLLSKLTDIGLTKPEAQLYLTGLELGPTTILQLSKVSEIKRTTIYSMIDSLVTKGIFEIQINGWKKLYAASSPSNLQSLIQKNYQNLLEIIPKLEAINSPIKEDIYLKTYSGKQNLYNLYTKILERLTPDSDYLIIGNMNMWGEVMGEFAEPFFVEREKICKSKNIKIRALFIDDEYARLQQKRQKLFGMKVKFLPTSNLKTNYVITNNMAIFHQVADSGQAFETNNPYIINTQKELFEILWQQSS